jgi:hypothetical protein
MGSEGQPPQPTSGHHPAMPIVRITIDDAVLLIGVLDLVGETLDPKSELGILVDRSAARVATRLQAFTDSLSPSVSARRGRGRRTTAPGPPPDERPTPA